MPTLLQPLGLVALLAALPVVALYVLRARRRRVKVGSTLLWDHARREVLARSPWKRLQPERSLLLELLAVLGVSLALATPVRGGRRATASVALVIDVSASMAAVGRSGTRLDDARTEALRQLARVEPDAEVLVLTAGRRPRVVAPLGSERTRAEAAVRAIAATDEDGFLGDAVALAADQLRPRSGTRRIVVITDGAVARPPATVPSDPVVEVIRVAEPRPNRALVRVDARVGRSGAAPEAVQVLALAANFSNAPSRVTVSVHREGERDAASRQTVTIAPRERRTVALEFPFDPRDTGRGLAVSLDGADDLATDDLAFTRIPPGSRMPVVLLGRAPDPWLRRALAADPEVVLESSAEETAEPLRPDALHVYDGLCPTRSGAGDVLVLCPPAGSCLGAEVAGWVDAPALTSFTTDDPRLRFLSLDGVHVARSRALHLRASGLELLRARDTVIGLSLGDASRAVTLLGFTPSDSDWPLRASFVVFVRNVVELARHHRARNAQLAGQVGEALRVPLPPSARDLRARGPMGDSRVTLQGGAAVLAETSRAGIYHLRWNSGELSVPVNLLSDAESDLSLAPWNPRVEDTPTAHRPRVLAPQSLAPWCALLAGMSLLADLLWLTRRQRHATVSA